MLTSAEWQKEGRLTWVVDARAFGSPADLDRFITDLCTSGIRPAKLVTAVPLGWASDALLHRWHELGSALIVAQPFSSEISNLATIRRLMRESAVRFLPNLDPKEGGISK